MQETGATFLVPALFGNGDGESVTGLSTKRPEREYKFKFYHQSLSMLKGTSVRYDHCFERKGGYKKGEGTNERTRKHFLGYLKSPTYL